MAANASNLLERQCLLKGLPIRAYDSTHTQNSVYLSPTGEWLAHFHAEKAELHIYQLPPIMQVSQSDHERKEAGDKQPSADRKLDTELGMTLVKSYPFSAFLQNKKPMNSAIDIAREFIESVDWSYGEKPVLFLEVAVHDANVSDAYLASSVWVVDPHQNIVKKISSDNADFACLIKISHKIPHIVLYWESNISSEIAHTLSYDIRAHKGIRHRLLPNGQQEGLPSIRLSTPPGLDTDVDKDFVLNAGAECVFDSDFNLRFIIGKLHNRVQIFKCKNWAPRQSRDAKISAEEVQLISKNDLELVFSADFTDPESVEIEGYSEDYKKVYLLDNRNKTGFAVLKSFDLETGDYTTVKKIENRDIIELVQVHDERGKRTIGYLTYHERPRLELETHLETEDRNIATLYAQLCDDKMDFSWPLVNYSTSDCNRRIAITDLEHPEKIKICAVQGSSLFTICSFDSGISPKLYRDHIPTRAMIVKTKEGMELVSYLKMPAQQTKPGSKADPVPLVVMLHGGPEARDYCSFSETDALLANRGIASLRINFRGSTGFGSDFCQRGEGAWGREVLDDVEFVVKGLINQGLIDRKRMIIAGFSYGGYEALAALAFRPGLFMAGIVGGMEADLLEVFEGNPSPMSRQVYRNQVLGRSFEDCVPDALRARSPFYHADKINVPVLIISGTQDRIIDFHNQTVRMTRKLAALGKKVTAFAINNEGHCVLKPENHAAVLALIESFIGQTFEIPVEPIHDELLHSNDLECIFGADLIRNLPELLTARAEAKEKEAKEAKEKEKAALREALSLLAQNKENQDKEATNDPSQVHEAMISHIVDCLGSIPSPIPAVDPPVTLIFSDFFTNRQMLKDQLREATPLPVNEEIGDHIVDYVGPTGWVG